MFNILYESLHPNFFTMLEKKTVIRWRVLGMMDPMERFGDSRELHISQDTAGKAPSFPNQRKY
jgi:hypothetical protein